MSLKNFVIYGTVGSEKELIEIIKTLATNAKINENIELNCYVPIKQANLESPLEKLPSFLSLSIKNQSYKIDFKIELIFRNSFSPTQTGQFRFEKNYDNYFQNQDSPYISGSYFEYLYSFPLESKIIELLDQVYEEFPDDEEPEFDEKVKTYLLHSLNEIKDIGFPANVIDTEKIEEACKKKFTNENYHDERRTIMDLRKIALLKKFPENERAILLPYLRFFIYKSLKIEPILTPNLIELNKCLAENFNRLTKEYEAILKIISLQNGWDYIGQLENGLPNGQGKMCKDHLYYIGQFKDGVPNGQGKMINRNKGITYIGQFQNGLPNGQGEEETSFGWNGFHYKGQFQNGIIHGHGELIKKNGYKYVGEFKNGVPYGHGHVEQPYPNGCKYIGQLQNGTMNGKGQLFFPKQALYKENEYGEKLAAFEEDCVFEGIFEGKLFKATGKIVFSNNRELNAHYEYIDDSKQGKITLSNGEICRLQFDSDIGNLNRPS
jgi:hypothetical protein